jgi:hypothetical protein
MGARSQRHMRETRNVGVDSDGHTRPVLLTNPTFTGTATNGSVLTGTNGTFVANTVHPVTIGRQWTRSGYAIPGAVNATYTLTAADVGYRIGFQNVGVNVNGRTVSASAVSAVIT